MDENRRGWGSPWLLVGILAVGAFTTSLNIMMISPLLKPISDDLGVSNAAAGQLATLMAGFAGLTALLVAPWLDRFSRRAWLQCESLLLGAGTVLSVLAPSFAWLFVGRALAGVGGAVIFAVCLAAVGDLFPQPSQRNQVIGVVGTAATLGAIVGLPVVAQLAAMSGWRWAMAAILPFAAILAVGASGLPRATTPRVGSMWHGWASGYQRVLANRETVSLLGVMVALCVAWFGWLIYFGAYAQTVFGLGAAALSLLFLVGGGAEVIANNVTPVLLRLHSPRTVVLGATVVLATNLLGVGIIYAQPWALIPFIAIASLSSVVVFTATSILLLDSQPAARGAVMALQSAGIEFGAAIGAASVGAGLAVLADYEAVYRLLGFALPVLVVPLVLIGCHRGPALGLDPAEAALQALPIAE